MFYQYKKFKEKQTIHTSNSDTFLFVKCIPGLELTGLAAVEYFFTAGTCSQTNSYRPPTVIAVLEQGLPVSKIKMC